MKYFPIIYILLILSMFSSVSSSSQNWNNSEWKKDPVNPCDLRLIEFNDAGKEGIIAEFDLKSPPNNWAIMRFTLDESDLEKPVVFDIKANASCILEIKMLDDKKDPNPKVHLRRINMTDKFKEWTHLVVYFRDLYDPHWVAGVFGNLTHFEFAFSSERDKSGTVWIRDIKFGEEGEKSSFPNLTTTPWRDDGPDPENSLVLEWLKATQDNGSPDQWLLPSDGINNNDAHTFNNAIVAMAFILKDERKRAERILDFYANSAKPGNEDPELQNFFYKGEARGFFQQVAIKNYTKDSKDILAYHIDVPSDRWMGDMCWLMLAYKYYETKYNDQRYKRIQCLLKGLILSWYKINSNDVYFQNSTDGYIRSGWRKNDTLSQVDVKLHEENGHPEGNIDAYAVLNLYGEQELANIYIKNWIDKQLGNGTGNPLDCYTWRVLSGEYDASILRHPDEDLRYKRMLNFNGKEVKGVYSLPDESVDEIWVDGVGQLACAFFEAGEKEKGYFLANQMDNYLIDDPINGKQCKALPYSIRNNGNCSVSISCAGWYIFAKNQFNPMTLKPIGIGPNKERSIGREIPSSLSHLN